MCLYLYGRAPNARMWVRGGGAAAPPLHAASIAKCFYVKQVWELNEVPAQLAQSVLLLFSDLASAGAR